MIRFALPLLTAAAAVTFAGEPADHVAWGAPAAAKTQPAPQPMPAADELLKNHIQVGVNYTWAHIHPHGLDSTHGNLGGVQGKYEYQIPESIYGAVSLSWRQGNTEDGNDRDLCYVDVHERLGYTFGAWRGWHTATLFTGFGYRHYGEDVSTPGDTVTFEYNEFYIPVGLLTNNQVSSWFSIGLNLIWMPQVYPTVKISPLKGARWILDCEYANFRVEMPFKFVVSERFHCFIVFEPHFEYWKDGKTTAATETGIVLGIPENTYLFAGANLNVGFDF